MIVNELCQKWQGAPWVESAIDDLLYDLSERGRRKTPKSVYKKCFFDKIVWLVDHCEPCFTLQQIDEYLIDCMQP